MLLKFQPRNMPAICAAFGREAWAGLGRRLVSSVFAGGGVGTGKWDGSAEGKVVAHKILNVSTGGFWLFVCLFGWLAGFIFLDFWGIGTTCVNLLHFPSRISLWLRELFGDHPDFFYRMDFRENSKTVIFFKCVYWFQREREGGRREREKEKEREILTWETSISCLPLVLWSGLEPPTFWCNGRYPTNRATPARAKTMHFDAWLWIHESSGVILPSQKGFSI